MAHPLLRSRSTTILQQIAPRTGRLTWATARLQSELSIPSQLFPKCTADAKPNLDRGCVVHSLCPFCCWLDYSTAALTAATIDLLRIPTQCWQPLLPFSGHTWTADAHAFEFCRLYGFPQSCIYPLLTVQHNGGMNFSNPVGVTSAVKNFGDPSCAPIPYVPMYAFFEGLGYQPNKDFFVACYDWRMSPFTNVGSDGNQLQNYRQMVEQAYNNTNGTKVYLMGHSNGPVYPLALLSSQSAQWRQQYIGEGFAYDYMVLHMHLQIIMDDASMVCDYASMMLLLHSICSCSKLTE